MVTWSQGNPSYHLRFLTPPLHHSITGDPRPETPATGLYISTCAAPARALGSTKMPRGFRCFLRGIRMHEKDTRTLQLVNGGCFQLCFGGMKKQHVSNGCKMEIFYGALFKATQKQNPQKRQTRAVKNGIHFCDTTKRASRRRTPHL